MINVLIVDDDAMVAELNRRYVAQLSGFHCCGTASTLEKAKEILFHGEHHIDLILLDIYMQKENGLDLLPVLHSEGCKCDVAGGTYWLRHRRKGLCHPDRGCGSGEGSSRSSFPRQRAVGRHHSDPASVQDIIQFAALKLNRNGKTSVL